jgi:hypothetical protein
MLAPKSIAAVLPGGPGAYDLQPTGHRRTAGRRWPRRLRRCFLKKQVNTFIQRRHFDLAGCGKTENFVVRTSI